jgi:hypothetical protein
MNLHGKVPVEQLDDERLTNIERKLVVAVSDMRAPAERAPRRLLAFAGMAMAVAISGLVGWKLRGDAPAAEPTVEVPQRFAINTDTANTLRLDDAVLTSGPASDLVVERSRGRVVIQMTRGTIDMQVTHDPSRVLIVRAGDTEIEDIGTRFRVEYDGKTHVEVRVTEGEVKVKRAGQHTDVAAGFAWTADRGKLTIAALDAVTTVVATGPTVAPPAAPSAPVGPTQVSPTQTAPTQAPHVTPAAPDSASAAGTSNGSAETGSGATIVRKPGKSNARIALDKLAIEEPLDVGTKDFNTAIAKYLDLAVSMGDAQDKTPVLYSMAVVQHRAHQDKAALYTLSGVIKRQGGKAYRAALWLNVRIECMQRFDDECRQAADLYLRRVPDGVAAGVAQAILTEIARQ